MVKHHFSMHLPLDNQFQLLTLLLDLRLLNDHLLVSVLLKAVPHCPTHQLVMLLIVRPLRLILPNRATSPKSDSIIIYIKHILILIIYSPDGNRTIKFIPKLPSESLKSSFGYSPTKRLPQRPSTINDSYVIKQSTNLGISDGNKHIKNIRSHSQICRYSTKTKTTTGSTGLFQCE